MILGYAIAGFESGDIWLYNGLFQRKILRYAIIGFVSADVKLWLVSPMEMFGYAMMFRVSKFGTRLLSVLLLEMVGYAMICFAFWNIRSWLFSHPEILDYAMIGLASEDVLLCYDWFRIWRCLSVFRLDMLEYAMIDFVSGNVSQSQDCFVKWWCLSMPWFVSHLQMCGLCHYQFLIWGCLAMTWSVSHLEMQWLISLVKFL